MSWFDTIMYALSALMFFAAIAVLVHVHWTCLKANRRDPEQVSKTLENAPYHRLEALMKDAK